MRKGILAKLLEGPTYSLCIECGPNVRVDEDGCCVTCGNGAMGSWVDKLRRAQRRAKKGRET